MQQREAPSRTEFATDFDDWPFTYEALSTEAMFVDHRYQRPLGRFSVHITENFNPRLVGTLIVSARPNKRYAVVDGQTRLAALRAKGIEQAPCLVFTGLSLEQEASLFTQLQTERRQVNAISRFRAALTAKEPRAIAVDTVLSELGFTVAHGHTDVGRVVSAINAVLEVYDRYGVERVRRIFTIIVLTWKQRSKRANTAEMILGLAHFLENAHPVDDDQLVAALEQVDPNELHTRAGQIRHGRGLGGRSPAYMSEVISIEYRRGKRKAKK